MIKEFFAKSWYHWKVLLEDRAFQISLLVGIFLLGGAYFANHFVSVYNDSQTFISVGDVILDGLPVYDMEFFYTWVMYGLFVLVFLYPVIFEPEIVPFALKTFALLIFLRCGFILLTNIGPPLGYFYEGSKIGGNVISDLMFKNDLFFSGHTAYPFLAFLIFKDTKLRWVFFVGSLLMAVTVLMMHIHYSIDVFAAFFIAHGTYALSDSIFNRLNIRFRNKVQQFGWAALQKRIRTLRDRRGSGGFDKGAMKEPDTVEVEQN